MKNFSFNSIQWLPNMPSEPINEQLQMCQMFVMQNAPMVAEHLNSLCIDDGNSIIRTLLHGERLIMLQIQLRDICQHLTWKETWDKTGNTPRVIITNLQWKAHSGKLIAHKLLQKIHEDHPIDILDVLQWVQLFVYIRELIEGVNDFTNAYYINIWA